MSVRRVRTGLGATHAVALAALAGAVAVEGQANNPLVSASVSPDTIRVGQVFEVRLDVSLPASADVRFPAVLPLPESIEQREAVDVESGDGRRTWTATYVLASWRADSLAIPPITAMVAPEGAAEFEISIETPRRPVLSILPADGADLALRDARPFLTVRAFPWWLLLLAAVAAAAVAWWLWRRKAPKMQFVPTGPGDRALYELGQLRSEWAAGGLTVGQFYDRYEGTLRRYARATRSWAPYRTMRELARGGDLFVALRRSFFVRFAHIRENEGGPEAALDAGERFVRSEMEPEEPAPGPTPGPAHAPEHVR